MMTNERVEQILASYGGHPEQWPAAERTAMLESIAANANLQFMQQQAIQLDEQLAGLFANDDGRATEDLAQRILDNLPETQAVKSPSVYHALTAWVRRHIVNMAYTAPVAATALVLLAVVVLAPLHQQTEQTGLLTASADDAWLMMAESLESPSDELALLAALEPELYDDGWDSL